MKRIQTPYRLFLLLWRSRAGSALAGFTLATTPARVAVTPSSRPFPSIKPLKSASFPKGRPMKVELTSPKDVDIQLIDMLTDTAIVHWQNGVVKGDASCGIFEGVEYCYSGYSGWPGNPEMSTSTSMEPPTGMSKCSPSDIRPGRLMEYSWEAPQTVWMPGKGNLIRPSSKMMWWRWEPFPPKKNVLVNLEADSDVDIEHHGTRPSWRGSGSTAQPLRPCLDSALAATFDYEGMTLSYSGFNGVDGQVGNEFIQIDGVLTQPLTVKAFAYAAGTAKVTYSWGPKDEDTNASAPADGTTTPADGNSTSSTTPDPALLRGQHGLRQWNQHVHHSAGVHRSERPMRCGSRGCQRRKVVV